MSPSAFLAALRVRLRVLVVVRGVAVVAVVVPVGVLSAVVLDWGFRLPGALRLTILVALSLAVAVALYRRLLRPLLRRLDDRDLALVVERRLPELDGRLISAVEGLPVDGDLERLLDRAALKRLLATARLPLPLLAAACAMGGAAAVVMTWPLWSQDGLNRLLRPLGAHEWTRRSGLTASVERAVVPAGEPVVLNAARRFGDEAPVVLDWVAGNAPAETEHEHRVLNGLSGPWRQALTLGPGAWTLRVMSADALPVELPVRVVPRPALARIDATLTPPAYTKRPAQHVTTLDCTALPGSQLSFSAGLALANGQQAATALARLGEQDVPLELEHGAFAGALTITAGGPLVMALADADGIAAQPAPRFTITLAEDRRPAVSISGPRSKESVTVRAQVQVTVEGSDDIGLAELALTVQVGDGARRDLTVFPTVSGLTATTRHATVDLTQLAAPGSRVVLMGRAADANDITGPGRADSAPIELLVVDEETLRQDLDRQLTEARDRATQAREAAADALANPTKRADALRSAALAAGRADETLATVVRRWQENHLPADNLTPIAEAAKLVASATPALDGAPGRSDADVKNAGKALDDAERILVGLLSDSDLTRRLAAIVERQKTLDQDSRAFVVEHLTKVPDAAGRTRQAELAARQAELAKQVQEVERTVLAGGANLAPAAELVRRAGASDSLAEAGRQLAGERDRTAAVERQASATQALVQLLELLRGSDAAAELAKRAAALADRQDRIARQIDLNGTSAAQADAERKVQDDTRRLAEQITGSSPSAKAAAQAAQAATAAQNAAAAAMKSGDRATAAREAQAATALLRDAARQLKGEDKQDDEKQPNTLVAALKRLRGAQAKLVAEAHAIDARLSDKPLDFPGQRAVRDLAAREAAIRSDLKTAVESALTRQPVAQLAVARVGTTLERSAKLLATPALGTNGMRLTRAALADLNRLLAMVEQRSKQGQNQPNQQQQDGGQQGEQNNGFPPQAEIALLLGMQDDLIVRTAIASDEPGALASEQDLITGLIGKLREPTKPGTRPNLLLSRAGHAARSATIDLAALSSAAVGTSGIALATRHQQEAASASLRRLLDESGQGGGGQPPPNGSGAPPPSGASAGNPSQAQGSPTSSGAMGGHDKPMGEQRDGVSGSDTERLDLPPSVRERLRQLRDQPMPPGALPVYERYLELLDEK